MLAQLGRLVLRHRRRVVVGWLILLVAGALGAGQVSKRLTFDFSLPGQPGYETAQQTDAIYALAAASRRRSWW
jgi:putative drug exporter of the RND superfamily